MGQNFLVDQEVVSALIAAGDLIPQDVVLEVGPGKGIVTKQLVLLVSQVIAVELDSELIAPLQKQFSNVDNVTIHQGDILTYQPGIDGNFKIVSSLPYQITSPFLHRVILMELGNVTHLSLLLQKEVALKITAQPPKASYLSMAVATFGPAKYVKSVPPEAFFPQPKVQSAIITITKKQETSFSTKGEIRAFLRFLHRGFSSPRKMLNKVFPIPTLVEAGIDPQRRAETLTLKEWQTLFALVKLGT